MDTAHLLTLPPELLHTVIDLIPARSDLLSLALACSTLRDIIIPTVLDYRFIVAAENHSGLWRQLIDSPYCARNVRQLTVFNRIEAPRHENLFRRLPSSSAGQDAPSSDELTVVDGDRKQPVVDDDEGELEDLRAAFALMSQVRKLNVRASGRLTDRDVREGKDLLSVACTQLRALEEVRIAWSRMPPTPDDDNFFDFVCYPICPMHPMWQLANLKTLEFSDLWLNGSVWPSFCDMLSLSPQLKTLAFPVFLPLELPSAPPMPKLPHLRRLSIPACFTNADIQEILLAFLSAHPDIHELRWSSSLLLPTPDTTFPTLPSLRAFRDTDTFFIERFLTDRAPGSVKLRTIDRIAFYFEPQRLLDALEAVQGDGVTRISVACLDSRPTLLALARMFPSLESLTLPAWCAWTKPRLVRRVGRVVWRALTTLQPARHNWRRVAIADVVPLFPALKSVRHVDVGDPVINKTRSKDAVREPPVGTEKVVEALRRKYPRLESVNGWKLR